MTPLSRSDLYSLETYAMKRKAFRDAAMAHKRARSVHLGAYVALLFEDRLTVQYQIQEMLRIERIFEPDAIQDELDAYNPLIPCGNDLKATMLIGFPDPDERTRELVRLKDIEHRVYADIEHHGRATTVADEGIDRSVGDKTSAVHVLRFVFSAEQIAGLRAGATLAFGIDDDRMPLRTDVNGTARDALLRDFA
jgi:Protein of unknown function (DUF3501)